MDMTDLRQAAVEILENHSGDRDESRYESPQELIHELRVQQVELEMQNDELRRVQLELEESRDRFAHLFDSAPVGYITLDNSDRIVEANLTVAALLGVSRERLAGKNLHRFVDPDETKKLFQHLREVSATKTRKSCELTLRTPKRECVQTRLDSISVGDQRRSIAITDLRENAELAKAKRESEERLQVICHALPIAIAYADQTGNYQFNNAAHEKWFNVSQASIRGRTPQDLYGDDVHEAMQSHRQRVLDGQTCSCQLEIRCHDGNVRLVDVRYVPHRDHLDQVVGCYELMFDVSADHKAAKEEAKLRELEDQLDALSQRQQIIFNLLMHGKSNKTISYELDLGMRTVERERHAILQTLHVATINELLVKFAGLAGCINPHRSSDEDQ